MKNLRLDYSRKENLHDKVSMANLLLKLSYSLIVALLCSGASVMECNASGLDDSNEGWAHALTLVVLLIETRSMARWLCEYFNVFQSDAGLLDRGLIFFIHCR